MYSGSLVLTPAESKRLIAKAVVRLPFVRQSMEQGRLIVANGTTNGFIAEELIDNKLDIPRYTAGVVTAGRYCATPADQRIAPLCFENGAPSDRGWLEILQDFTAQDVLIKGANCFDHQGNAGVLVADRQGGTIGRALGSVLSRGSQLLIPVGLEKLILDVKAAAKLMGIKTYHRSLGMGSGLITITQGQIFTEIDAFQTLFGLQATMVSSGGIGGSEGSVGFVLTGTQADLDQAWPEIRKIKGEPAVKGVRQQCSKDCPAHCHYIRS